MKKKLLGMVMTVCLLVGSTMTVSASQLHMNGETANVPVTYDNQSSFCINIPESIDLNDSAGYTFTADYMYITDSQKVCVYAPADAITMTNEYGLTGTARLYTNGSNGDGNGNCVASFLRDQTTADMPMYGMFDGMAAGHYEGTATFTICLETNSN